MSENCGFECHWSEKNPDLTMISSFDGKVSIHSIQKGASCDDESNDSPGSIPNDDPFAAAIMQG